RDRGSDPPVPRRGLRHRLDLLFRRMRAAAALARPRDRRRLLQPSRGARPRVGPLRPNLFLCRGPAGRSSASPARLCTARRFLGAEGLPQGARPGDDLLLEGPGRTARDAEADAVLDEGAGTLSRIRVAAAAYPISRLESWGAYREKLT